MKMNACLLGLTFALICSSSRGIAAENEPQQEHKKVTYLVIYRPGPAWLVGKSVLEQPLKEHGKYMLGLYIKGSMKLGGPLTDDAGGAVLLAVADESEAKTIVTADPAVKSGIFVYEMHPWKLQPWDEFAKKAKSSPHPVTPTEHQSGAR
jgi:uncharacterized protein YciI